MATIEITSNAAATLFGDPNATLTLDDVVGDFGADFDMEGANAEYAEAVSAVLSQYRPGWSIAGDFIFADLDDSQPLDEVERRELKEQVREIDAAAILSRHARTR